MEITCIAIAILVTIVIGLPVTHLVALRTSYNLDEQVRYCAPHHDAMIEAPPASLPASLSVYVGNTVAEQRRLTCCPACADALGINFEL